MTRRSADVDELVGLEGETPGRMGFAVFDGFVKKEAVLPVVAGVAGLEETPFCNDRVVDVHVLAGVDDFQFIAFCERELCGGYHIVFRGACDPVNAGRERTGAVGLDSDVSAAGMEGGDKFICQEKGGFAAGDDSEAGRVCRNGIDDFLCRHETTFLMGGIAEGAAEVAAGKAHEYGGSAGVAAFSLEGIEYFVDLVLLHDMESMAGRRTNFVSDRKDTIKNMLIPRLRPGCPPLGLLLGRIPDREIPGCYKAVLSKPSFTYTATLPSDSWNMTL